MNKGVFIIVVATLAIVVGFSVRNYTQERKTLVIQPSPMRVGANASHRQPLQARPTPDSALPEGGLPPELTNFSVAPSNSTDALMGDIVSSMIAVAEDASTSPEGTSTVAESLPASTETALTEIAPTTIVAAVVTQIQWKGLPIPEQDSKRTLENLFQATEPLLAAAEARRKALEAAISLAQMSPKPSLSSARTRTHYPMESLDQLVPGTAPIVFHDPTAGGAAPYVGSFQPSAAFPNLPPPPAGYPAVPSIDEVMREPLDGAAMPPSAGPISIQSVSLHSEGGRSILRIDASAPFKHKVFSLVAPDRLVVDLLGQWTNIVTPNSSATAQVKNVRVGRQDSGVRIVCDLEGRRAIEQRIANEGRSIEVILE